MSAPPPTSPTLWRHFNILRRIGVGGMGELFLADDLRQSPPRRVVLKRLHAHLTADASIVKMFTREAEIVASLTHPNIVRFIGTERDGDTFVLVLEWVDGHDLRHLVDQNRTLPPPPAEAIAVCIGLDVLAGLDYAHRFRANLPGGKKSRGLIHRDVSPQNIVVSTTGIAKIIDFGVAKVRGQAQSTRIGALKGKFAYMSPERIRGETVDGRADLYALGIVLYEVATLRRPFAGLAGLKMMDAILAGQAIPPQTARRDLSPAFAAFLSRAIAPALAERFQSPADMAAALLATVNEKTDDPVMSMWLIESQLRPQVVAWLARCAPPAAASEVDSTEQVRDAPFPFGTSPFDAVPAGSDFDGDEARNDATQLGDSLPKGK